MSRRDDAQEIMARLQRHYIKPGEEFPGGVFLPETAIDDHGVTRRADALYIGFTSASGRRLIGHEVKVHRSDWLAELAQPEKSEAWVRECHAWYIVAPSTDVVPVEELPEGWGLMVPGRSKTRMDIKVKAALHAERTPSWKAMHAITVRQDTLRAAAIRERVRNAEQRLRGEVEERVRRDIARETGLAHTERLQRERDDAKAAIKSFGEALDANLLIGEGVEYEWRHEDIAARLAAEDIRAVVHEGRSLRMEREEMRHVARRVEDALRTVQRAVKQFDEKETGR